jgi:hypothetical protein
MSPAVLVDTNAIIEAVRTGCWAAITGQLRVETVAACRDEAMAGSPDTIRDYVPVARAELTRLAALHEVSPAVQAAFKLAYGDADSLDAGEHDLLAHAYASGADDWTLCSPDKAAIRAAVTLGFADRLTSLEDLVRAVGSRARPPLRAQFTSAWLASFRTRVLLDGL